MIDIEKLNTAKVWIEKLANGILLKIGVLMVRFKYSLIRFGFDSPLTKTG